MTAASYARYVLQKLVLLEMKGGCREPELDTETLTTMFEVSVAFFKVGHAVGETGNGCVDLRWLAKSFFELTVLKDIIGICYGATVKGMQSYGLERLAAMLMATVKMEELGHLTTEKQEYALRLATVGYPKAGVYSGLIGGATSVLLSAYNRHPLFQPLHTVMRETLFIGSHVVLRELRLNVTTQGPNLALYQLLSRHTSCPFTLPRGAQPPAPAHQKPTAPTPKPRSRECGPSKTPDPFSWFRKTSCTEGGADSTSRSFMYQKGFEEGLAGLGLDDKSDCESEDESNFRRPSSHSALKQKNGGKGKPSGLFEHLAAHGREFSKLSKHAAQLKRLSGSVMNVLNLDDAQDTRQAKAQRKESTRVPIVTHLTNHVPVIKPACSLFLEGAPGVGKTTMLNHLKAVFGDLTIVVPEPMRYWTHVYENAIKAMHKNVTRARHGREDTSAEVLACQMKFTTPFRVLASRKRSLLVTESGARSVAPLDCWILHDRHLLSASVVFPLMLLRSQLLSYSDFIQVLATFTADPGDTIVWMKLNVEENMRRLKKRGRKHESGLDAGYLKSVNDAYHAVYCAWLLTQYFAPEDIVKVCAGLTTITTVCHQSHTPIIRSGVAEKLYKNSIFSVLKEVIQPFRADAVLLEVCLAFTRTLAYLQFVLVDLSEFQDDLPGCWTEIYMQALKNPAIRSQFFDWAGLSKVISDFERGNRD